MRSRAIVMNIIFLNLILACSTTSPLVDSSKKEYLDGQKSVIVGYLDRGQANAAHRDLRQLIKDNPNDKDLQNLMGLTNLALNNKKKALENFRKAYALSPETPFALNLSSCLVELGRYKEAEKILTNARERGVGTYPYPERLEHNLGLVSEKLKKYESAESYYVAALTENPTFYLSLLQLGKLYLRQNKLDMASSKLKLATIACPVCFDAVESQIDVMQRKGLQKDARELLAQYLKQKNLNPSELARAQSKQENLSKLALDRRNNNKETR